MLRGLILVAGYLIFMFPHTIAVCAGEDTAPSAKSISVPDAHEGQLASGIYLVIGTFQKLSNAQQFRQRHKKFDAALFPVTLKGKRVSVSYRANKEKQKKQRPQISPKSRHRGRLGHACRLQKNVSQERQSEHGRLPARAGQPP